MVDAGRNPPYTPLPFLPLLRSAFRACHFARVECDQRALIVVDCTRVLTDVAGVVNAPGQFTEITLFDGFEGAYPDLGGFGDLLERDPTITADRRQTQDAFFLFHLPASPSVNPLTVPTLSRYRTSRI